MEDYTVNVPSPFEALMTGAQQGAGLAQLALQRQQRELELQRQQRQQQFLQDFIAKPVKTADDYARATLAIPGMREQFKQSWELQNTAQQETTKKESGAIFSALNAGKVDFAKGLMQEKITALENSGGDPQEIKAAKTMLQAMDIDPNMARDQVGLYLTSIPGGKELIEGYTKISAEEREKVKFPVAQSKALIDIEKAGWDIKKVQSDIDLAAETKRIQILNAQLKREENDLKRRELRQKLVDAEDKREEKIRLKGAELETGRAAIDNMLNTADRILKNPSLNDVLGTVEGRAPAIFSDEAADAIALIDTLGSQAFVSQIQNMKGLGALSDAEGKKLQSALQNLSRTQSERQFRENLKEAQRLMLKSRSNLASRYGMRESVPDTPAATAPNEINDLLTKYGVQ